MSEFESWWNEHDISPRMYPKDLAESAYLAGQASAESLLMEDMKAKCAEIKRLREGLLLFECEPINAEYMARNILDGLPAYHDTMIERAVLPAPTFEESEMNDRKQPKEIAQAAYDNGHVPTFLAALCALIMCADPTPLTPEQDEAIRRGADSMAQKLGFADWVEAYHGLN